LGLVKIAGTILGAPDALRALAGARWRHPSDEQTLRERLSTLSPKRLAPNYQRRWSASSAFAGRAAVRSTQVA
jgi:hypothetical protein